MIRLAITLLTMLASAATAASSSSEVTARIRLQDRVQMERLAALSPATLDDVARAVAPDRLRERATALLASGNLEPGYRLADSNGIDTVHAHLLAELRKLEPAGVRVLGSFRTTFAAPAGAVTPGGDGSWVAVGGRTWPVSPLWPNGALPSLCPTGGVTGQLIDTGTAEWRDLDGLDLEGSVALMSFKGSRNWARLASLGCAAVIVYEDDNINRESAEGLFCNTPVPCPRFYVDAAAGRALRALAGNRATVAGGHRFVTRTTGSLFAYLPPTAPVRHTVRETDLIERIAAESGVTPTDLQAVNRLPGPSLRPGQVLEMPGQAPTYTVKAGDLLDRLAREYGLTAEALAATNALTSRELTPGTVLTIPNLDQTQIVAVRLDSTSVVPGAAHGAKPAVNTAIALASLEHLATSPQVVRRKGVIFAFLDGDNHGGIVSRSLAAEFLRAAGGLRSMADSNENAAADRYDRVHAYLTGSGPTLESRDGRWLAEEWLTARVEARRVELVEARVAGLRRELDARDPTLRQRYADTRAGLERDIEWLASIRNRSLSNTMLGMTERVEAFLRAVGEPGRTNDITRLGLDFPSLLARFEQERAEERQDADIRAGNAALVDLLRHHVAPPASAPSRSTTGWLWDLSDGSAHLGLARSDVRGIMAIAPGDLETVAGRLRDAAALAASQAHWTEPWTFMDGGPKTDFVAMKIDRGPTYSEFWSAANIGLFALVTLNDRQDRLDTPHDTLDRLDFATLSVQARTALTLLGTALENAADGTMAGTVKPPQFGLMTGRALQFNIRSGIDAQDPVPGALIYCPAHKERTTPTANSATACGTRLGTVLISRMNGRYTMPLEALSFKGSFRMFAYHLDPATGLFDKVLDNAQIGTQKQTPVFALQPGQASEKNLILTAAYPFAVFPGPDPMDYKTDTTVTIQDAALNGAPQHFGLESDLTDFSETQLDCHIAYVEPGRRIRLVFERAARTVGLLVGAPTSARDLKGLGHTVGPQPDGRRNLVLPMTPLAMAREMQALATARQELYRMFGIRDKGIDEALALARERLAAADEALGRRRWQAAAGAAREAWGIVAKNYPGLMRLGREAVFSVVILMAFMIPGCLFIESLAIGARSITGRLAGSVAIFCAGSFFLNAFHPAFRIAVSPFIVMIAFTMILMSAVVLSLSYQKFEVLVRRARIAGGEVESEEISLASSLSTAFSLGVSNLKKRLARSLLTAFTVSVLTFSILSFVSVRGQDRIVSRPLGYDRDIEGRQASRGDLIVPGYTGVMFRTFIWGDITSLAPAIRTEFGSDHEIVTRGFYVEAEGGNSADREGVNQIEVTFGKSTAVITALMTFEPAETRFSGLHRAVTRGQWLLPAGNSPSFPDRFSVILPDTAAHALGITEAMVYTPAGLRPAAELPRVRMMNNLWRVVGILDTTKADLMRDINGKSLAMVDHLRSAITPSQGSGNLETEADFYHVSWRRLAIIPLEAAADVGARSKSVVVKFNPGENADTFLSKAAARLNSPMIGNMRGEPALLTAQTAHSVAGAAKLIVPIILCILIVTNTMMGTVDERKGEVQMLGAIGLSPSQIAFLLMAESTVFSIMGIILGTFAGLLFSQFTLHASGLFGQLSFNFTSLASTGLALGTGLVVMFATLLPARRAAALAAPSGMEKWKLPPPAGDGRIVFVLPFTLTRGNAVGMVAFFRRFLLNHAEATSTDFNCRDIRVTRRDTDDAEIGLAGRMWLAPYDLDVAQDLELGIRPTENAGVFAVAIRLNRTSGTEDAWLRTNHGFLDLVRLQFLLWRNLDEALRKRYIEDGADLLGRTPEPGAAERPAT